MRTILLDGYTMVTIEDNMVAYFELMGDRWVSLGPAERYSDEMIAEEFGEYM